jgi:hypothetical protein
VDELIGHAAPDAQARRDFRNRVRLDLWRSFSEIGSSRSKRTTSNGMTLVVTFEFLSQLLALALSSIPGCLLSFACSGCCGQGERSSSSSSRTCSAAWRCR